jgi:hypothetical protein
VTAADAARLRAVALAYPEATEDFPWGHTAVKVRGKAFLFLSGEAGTLSVTCKLPAQPSGRVESIVSVRRIEPAARGGVSATGRFGPPRVTPGCSILIGCALRTQP